MKVIALKGDVREGLGKAITKKIRQAGKVPCVVYGNGENQNFSVYQADFKHLVYTPNTYLVQLNVGDQSKLAKVQELQFHPVSDDIIHADFYEVDPAKPVSIPVPVKVVGNSPGVRAGGKLQLKIKKLNVLGLIADIPDFIEVNIDKLAIGKSVKVKDIKLDGLTLLDSENNSIVSVIITRASRSAAGSAGAEDDADDSEESGEE